MDPFAPGITSPVPRAFVIQGAEGTSIQVYSVPVIDEKIEVVGDQPVELLKQEEVEIKLEPLDLDQAVKNKAFKIKLGPFPDEENEEDVIKSEIIPPNVVKIEDPLAISLERHKQESLEENKIFPSKQESPEENKIFPAKQESLEEISIQPDNLESFEEIELLPEKQESLLEESKILLEKSESSADISIFPDVPDPPEEIRLVSEEPDSSAEIRILPDEPDSCEGFTILPDKPQLHKEILILPDDILSSAGIRIHPDKQEPPKKIEIQFSNKPESCEGISILPDKPQSLEEISILPDKSKSSEDIRILPEKAKSSNEIIKVPILESGEDAITTLESITTDLVNGETKRFLDKPQKRFADRSVYHFVCPLCKKLFHQKFDGQSLKIQLITCVFCKVSFIPNKKNHRYPLNLKITSTIKTITKSSDNVFQAAKSHLALKPGEEVERLNFNNVKRSIAQANGNERVFLMLPTKDATIVQDSAKNKTTNHKKATVQQNLAINSTNLAEPSKQLSMEIQTEKWYDLSDIRITSKHTLIENEDTPGLILSCSEPKKAKLTEDSSDLQILSKTDCSKDLPSKQKPGNDVAQPNSEDTKRTINIRVYNKCRVCFYCRKSFADLTKHLQSVHKDENYVAEASTNPEDQEKQKRFRKLLGLGAFIHNCKVLSTRNQELIMAQRPEGGKIAWSNIRACPECFGLVVGKQLWCHMLVCNPSLRLCSLQHSEGLLCTLPKNPPKLFKNSILDKLAGSCEGDVARNDKLIKQFGYYKYKRERESEKKDSYVVKLNRVRAEMQMLAAVLLRLREINQNDVACLKDFLTREGFDLVVQAVKELNLGRVGMGFYLQVCAFLARGNALRRGNLYEDDEIKAFLDRFKLEWQIYQKILPKPIS